MNEEPTRRTYITPEVLHDAPVSNQKETADFHFDDFAATLARLIASKETDTPLVIGINGAWGSGKTSLLMRTRRMLDQTAVLLRPEQPAKIDFLNPDDSPEQQFRACRTVWFDAWKYGGEDQILAALLRVILAEMQKDGFWERLQAEKEKKEFQWFNFLGDALIQFASAGTYSPKIGDYVVETPLKQASAFFDYFDESLTRLLETWVKYKPKGKDNSGEIVDSQQGVLVVFVDDLDRCLPDKTVQALEAMKLFLDKPGCVFVLGADAEIVRQAVETHYKNIGITGEKAKDYLEKVIQLRFDLPPIMETSMETYLRGQKVSGAMLQRWKALVAAAEVNPRRVKSVINDLNLQWFMAVNSGQTQGINRDDFICWQALIHAAPTSFARQIAELSESPEVRHQFVLNAVKWQAGSEDDKKTVEGFYSAYKEERRLRGVLKQIQFSTEFTPQALSAMIHMVTPQPEKTAEEPAAVQERQAEAPEAETPDIAKTPHFWGDEERGSSPQPSREGARFLGDSEFMFVPKGKFIMGSKQGDKDADDDEKSQQTLEIPYDYWMARFTVTNAQFEEFVTATGYKTTAEEKGSAYAYNGNKWEEIKGATWQRPRGPNSSIEGREQHPVVSVSWLDALAFVKWFNDENEPPPGFMYRLPTEAEWEKAARGLYGNIYPWGNPFDPSLCNSRESGKMDTLPVQAFPAGASPYGCEQMAGNVWEWTHSLYKPYPYDVKDGREDEIDTSGNRVLRGGSFSPNRQALRAALRGGVTPDDRVDDYGFRVCLAPTFATLNL